MGKTLLSFAIGITVAIIVFYALATLINVTIWIVVAALAVIIATTLFLGQIALYGFFFLRFGHEFFLFLVSQSISWRLRTATLVLAIGAVSMFIVLAEAIAGGLIGKLAFPMLFASEQTLRWLLEDWASTVPGFMGWQPGIGIQAPTVPWANPLLLGAVALPFAMLITIVIGRRIGERGSLDTTGAQEAGESQWS